MPSGPDVGFACLRRGEAQRMVDRAGGDLIIAHQASQDRQASRIRRRPGVGPERVGAQVEDRAGAGLPTPIRLRPGVVELIQLAGALVEDQYVAVAIAVRPALDRRVRRDGVGAGIALVVVVERHRHGRADRGRVRDADRPAVPQARAEIRVDAFGRADGIDISLRVGGNRQGVDARVPDVVGWEDRACGWRAGERILRHADSVRRCRAVRLL